MIVTCEVCKTRFRLDPNRIRPTGSKVRCSRCQHVFFVTREDEGSVAEELPVQAAIEPETPARSRAASRGPGRAPMPASLRKKRKSWKGMLLWGAFLVIVTGAVLGGAFYLSERKILSTSQSVPVGGGKSISREAERSAVTILDAVQAYFMENVHMEQIFVVEGTVRNDASHPLSFILLEGKLYTTDNKVYQTQKFYCANVMTRDELNKLTAADIQNRMMNREGKELLNVHVAPQGKIPFMVVFHNLPALNQLRDYSIEVVSSEIDERK